MKKGFTLIELLAVISLLAIVALIATPIILNVIDDSKESANLRSIEGYARAIKQEYYNQSMDGSIPVIDETFLSNVEKSGGDVVCENILYSTDNGVIMYKCKFPNTDKEYCYADEKHYACDDSEFLNIFTGNGGEVALEGTPIIEKVKELVYDNGACKTDGTTYQYMGGCYLKGNPNNNYIWYSGFLWRIMGINADGTVRLITNENVTSISYHENSSSWDTSYVKDWLNKYFYPKLKGNNIIKEEIWCNEITTDKNSARSECTNNLSTNPDYVGSITLDEYNLAGGFNSYLYISQFQWIMTPYSSSNIWLLNGENVIFDHKISFAQGIRPVVNVDSDTNITGGNGTVKAIWDSESGPYILNEDKNTEVIGKLNEKVTSGEHVIFAGKKYRVVDKDSDGNVKLILDGFYEEKEGTPYKMAYGDNNVFSTTTGIGEKLNGDVLNWITNSDDIEKTKLVSDYSWYQNNLDDGQSYTLSLKEDNYIRKINSTVGLIRVGEMLSGQSSSILTKGYTAVTWSGNAIPYWAMTSRSSLYISWVIGLNGATTGVSSSAYTYGLRPVIVVKSNVEIISGTGTFSNPYQI